MRVACFITFVRALRVLCIQKEPSVSHHNEQLEPTDVGTVRSRRDHIGVPARRRDDPASPSRLPTGAVIVPCGWFDGPVVVA